MDNLTIAITAINKFMYHSWNYPMQEYTIEYHYGETKHKVLPRFIMEAKWGCDRLHMIGKWESCITDRNGDSRDPHSFLSHFYAELDGTNRKALIEWIMDNYNNEVKI